jgi:hypothetical protein
MQRGSLMEVDVKQDCTGVNWKAVSETLKIVEMAHFKKAAAMKERGFTE